MRGRNPSKTKTKNQKETYKMKTETAIITAAVLGTIAFNEGRSSVPAHDPELLKVIGQRDKKEMGAGILILKAWTASWHAANLAAA
jgi:hypothetical protein